MIDLNEHIDFLNIFKELYKEHIEELTEDRYIADHFNMLMTFVESNEIDSFEIMLEECSFSDREITFVFGKDLEQANESSNYVATADYFFVYDRLLGEFTKAEYEQG